MTPTNDLYTTALNTAQQAALEVGKMLKDQFLNTKHTAFKIKAKHQIVTKADKLAEQIIIKKIKQKFPDHNILSEEGGGNIKNTPQKKDNTYTWVIDPLDGTTNFATKNDFFCTSIALVENNKPSVGVVYAPMYNELYTAIRDQGAFLNDDICSANNSKTIDNTFNAFCYGGGDVKYKIQAANYYRTCLEKGIICRQLGAAALELARVASGVLDSMTLPGAYPWDVMAGALLVQEAGGIVTDLKNKEYSLASTSGMLATTNSTLHSKIQKLLRVDGQG